MKKGLIILAFALAIGACMFVCTRKVLAETSSAAMPVEKGSRLPELHWLRQWLALDDTQFARVEALHVAYLPKCEELCARVHESNTTLLSLSKKHTHVDTTLGDSIQSRAQLTSECQQALLEHVYQTAACMNPEQAKRYLDFMIPNTLGISCCAAPAAHR